MISESLKEEKQFLFFLHRGQCLNLEKLLEGVGIGERGILQRTKQVGHNMDDVLEMFLCETERVILKPNQLYRFNVDPNCDRCKYLAKEGDPSRLKE